MRSKTKKSISILVGIWTFLLVLIFKVIFSTPAYAFLSSLDACAANPECVAVVGSELSPAVAAPTAEAAGTTAISTTTATGATSSSVEAVAGITVVGDTRLSGVAAFYIWNRDQNEQAQKKAAERYCQANPHDGVCAALQYQTGDAGNGDPDACKLHITQQFSYPFTINLIQAPDAQCGTTTVYAIDGIPYSRGVYPKEVQQPANWKDWSQEKRDAAVKLLNDSDWQGLITSMPNGGTLNPGDTINAPTIVIPGTDGTKTQSGPYTIPESYPNALPSPSPDPSPSPSPEESPSPSPDPSPGGSPPTASDNPPSPSPDSSPSPSPEESPSPSAPTASGGAPSPSKEVTPEVIQNISDIVNSYKPNENFKCVECANQIEAYLKEQGIHGRRVKLDTPRQTRYDDFIYDDSLPAGSDAIATNGHHEGIAIKINGEERVFDNHHPEGVPKEQWINNLVFDSKIHFGASFIESGYLF